MKEKFQANKIRTYLKADKVESKRSADTVPSLDLPRFSGSFSAVALPRYNLVVDQDVKKPTKQTNRSAVAV